MPKNRSRSERKASVGKFRSYFFTAGKVLGKPIETEARNESAAETVARNSGALPNHESARHNRKMEAADRERESRIWWSCSGNPAETEQLPVSPMLLHCE